MHKQQILWMRRMREKFPNSFKNRKVLEVGSANINGSNREHFEDCDYTGVDVQPYNGVDVVSIFHEYEAEPESYDLVLSTNQLEHDMYWELTLKKMLKLLKPSGLFLLQCACNWAEHGTARKGDNNSLTSQMVNDWANYYRNIGVKDFVSVIDPDKEFSQYELLNDDNMDLFVWGLKR